ncbi:hypothetical protein V5O48_012116 [Marasmius crinis-equi]|uniref:Protein kinase domain-containing protein n=1 Tax=Marasmius crinis-equi TaxID=585013 RepID=A0ABR3F3P2_9AGAR
MAGRTLPFPTTSTHLHIEESISSLGIIQMANAKSNERLQAIQDALTVKPTQMSVDSELEAFLPPLQPWSDKVWTNETNNMIVYPDIKLLQKMKGTQYRSREGNWQSDFTLTHVEYIVTQLTALSGDPDPELDKDQKSEWDRKKKLIEEHFKMQSQDTPEAMKTLSTPDLLNTAWDLVLNSDYWDQFPHDRSAFDALMNGLYRAHANLPYLHQQKCESYMTVWLPQEGSDTPESYAPVSDFALLESNSGTNSSTITIWGEYDSGDKQRLDCMKGQVVAFCNTRLWKAIHDHRPRYMVSLWASRKSTAEALCINIFHYPSQGAEILHYQKKISKGTVGALNFLRLFTHLLTRQRNLPLTLSREIATLKDHIVQKGLRSKKSKNTRSPRNSRKDRKRPHDPDDDHGGASGSDGTGAGGGGGQSSNKRRNTDTQGERSSQSRGSRTHRNPKGGTRATTLAIQKLFSHPPDWTPLNRSNSAPQLNRRYFEEISDQYREEILDVHAPHFTQTATFSVVLDDPPAQWMFVAEMLAAELDDSSGLDDGSPSAFIQKPSDDIPIAAAKLVKKLEIEISKILQYIPGVVKVIAAPHFEADLWLLVTKYAGERLTDYVHSHPQPHSPPLLLVLMQILDTVQEIHEAGYVHLDIKHDNIVIQATGSHRNVATILDFGHARSIAAGAPDTLYGTKGWSAPESESGNTCISSPEFTGLGNTQPDFDFRASQYPANPSVS